MIPKYEIEEMIIRAFDNLNGHIDEKPNNDGGHDTYLIEVNDDKDGIIVDVETVCNGDFSNGKHDKYKITVEYLP